MAATALADLPDRAAYVDPASGKKSTLLKRTSSRSAIIVVAQDALKRVYVLKAWAGRIPSTTLTDMIFKAHTEWAPRIIGIDASAMQSLYADAILREASQRRHRLPLDPQPNVTDKLAYIRSVLPPVINNKRLIMSDEHRDLFNELEAFPSGMTMDLVDALAHAIELLPKRAAAASEERERKDLEAYLHEVGAPQFYQRAVRSAA